MKKIAVLALLACIVAAGAYAADLTISTQVNLTAMDYANNFFSFKGAVGTSDKDQFALKPDATSGASKLESTVTFNPYRTDVQGKKLIPGGVRNLFLYGIADYGTLTGDNLTVTKDASGVITIQSCHRGTAYKIVTDASGKLVFPNNSCSTRVIGTTSNQVSTDFSPTGKTADIVWAKVWDSSIADGTQIGTSTAKTGKILPDIANSALFQWTGALQVSFDGTYLKVSGSLNAAQL